MPRHRYVEEIGLAAMPAAKRLVGEGMCTTHASTSTYPGFPRPWGRGGRGGEGITNSRGEDTNDKYMDGRMNILMTGYI